MDNKQILQEARYLLKGKWIKLSIIYLLFFTFFSYVNNAPTMLNTSSTALTLGMTILGLILTIFLVPFFYGLIDVMVRAARGEKVRLFEFVSVGLKNFKNAYFLVFFTIINLAIPILTFDFTAFITDWASRNGNSFLTVTFGILYLISTFFLFARFFYYVIGIFVMIDNKDKNVKQILDEFNYHGKIAIMVEIPATIFLIDKFIELGVDGFIVGMNDLTTLMLSATRETVYHDKNNPVLMKIIKDLQEKCKKNNREFMVAGYFDESTIMNLLSINDLKIVVNYANLPNLNKKYKNIRYLNYLYKIKKVTREKRNKIGE